MDVKTYRIEKLRHKIEQHKQFNDTLIEQSKVTAHAPTDPYYFERIADRSRHTRQTHARNLNSAGYCEHKNLSEVNDKIACIDCGIFIPQAVGGVQ